MEERDPDFVPKAVEVIEVHLQPPPDGPTFCVAEKTGSGVRTPCAPSQPVAPGQPARQEFEYVRHGTADLLAACEVQSGTVHGLVRRQHRSAEFIALLRLLDAAVPRQEVIPLILDPARLPCSAEVAVYLAWRPWRFRFHWLPRHASGLSFIEAWCALLSKKSVARSALADFAAASDTILRFIATYTTPQAHPFTWKKGVRFYHRLKDKLAGSVPVVAA